MTYNLKPREYFQLFWGTTEQKGRIPKLACPNYKLHIISFACANNSYGIKASFQALTATISSYPNLKEQPEEHKLFTVRTPFIWIQLLV